MHVKVYLVCHWGRNPTMGNSLYDHVKVSFSQQNIDQQSQVTTLAREVPGMGRELNHAMLRVLAAWSRQTRRGNVQRCSMRGVI
jgi:hypothetical protein